MFWQCFGGRTGQRKTQHCKIVLLDETELIQGIQATTRGQDLLDIVYRHLNLLETPYFGLRYLDAQGQTHWLEPHKKVIPQLKETNVFSLYFGVKFYASDPCKLLEEITRYQFFLQVKQDILQGRLPVSNDLGAHLFAYAVQSELGDYDSRRHQTDYISEFRFLPQQATDLEAQVAKVHKDLAGQVPSVAEMNFLERVKWLDMYGVDLHPVLGKDSIEYYLGLTPSGVLVLRNKTKVGNYFWPRITKVYFKGKYFMLRVRDKLNEEHTYGFELPTRQSCKHLWKCCVEHHAFFRLTQVREVPGGQPGKVFSLGSRFRYSGRTEKQVQSDILSRTQPTVVRVPSRRYHRRLGQPDGADAVPSRDEVKEYSIPLETRVNISVPQPVTLQRSSSTPLSPSAPWEEHQHRGLYSSSANPSPRSVRSSASTGHRHSRRISSADSDSSCDTRRRRHHRSRKSSDNDSEASSRGSRGSRSGHRRRKSSQGESDSDSHSHQSKSKHHRRHHRSHNELVDSGAQWREVQRQQELTTTSQLRPQSAVIRDLTQNRRSGYINSGMETESEVTYHRKKKNRRHRSKSPENSSKKSLPPEIKQHIEYRLVDPVGMSEDQLRDIKYTRVETSDRLFRIRYSPSPAKNMNFGLRQSTDAGEAEESPPPPYSAASTCQSDGPLRSTSLGCLQSEHKDTRTPIKHPWPLTEMNINAVVNEPRTLNRNQSQSKPDVLNGSPTCKDITSTRSYNSSPRVTFQSHESSRSNQAASKASWIKNGGPTQDPSRDEMSTEL